MTVTDPRLRAVLELTLADARESAGLHEFDGVLQDLSPAGVTAALARLGQGAPPADAYDAAVLQVVEDGLRVAYGELELHRRDPLPHVFGLDLACYDREYAPAGERAEARRRHLAQWPAAVDNAIEALDRVPAPVATATLPAVRGLREGVDDEAALAAVDRLVAHVERCEREGDPDASLGAERFARAIGAFEGTGYDVSALARVADAERARLREVLDEAVERHAPGEPASVVVPRLLRDHAETAGEIYAEAQALIDEITAFAVERDLIGAPGGVCRVGPAPASRSFAQAMMSWSAPFEADAPSWYYIVPPDPSWSAEEAEEWLSVFSRASLPTITVHEVTPGHYAHGRSLRALDSDVRRSLLSPGFVEGWAHYVEEVYAEERFRDGDPVYVIGMCVEALLRVTRLTCAVGVHTGAMTVADATALFERDAFLRGTAATGEARRATYDPTYGRYTLGKLEIRRVRDLALAQGMSLRGFHDAMLALGGPPLGLLERGVLGQG